MTKTIQKMLNKAYGNAVEGPFGLAMSEKTARALEDAVKEAPGECRYKRLAMPVPVESFRFEEGERADVSWVNTDGVDRDGEVFLPQGGDWKGYDGVVTWAHDYSQLPVGRNMWMKAESRGERTGWLAKTQYHTRPDNWTDMWVPDAIVHLQKQNPPSLTGKSIGAMPMSVREATKDEVVKNPHWKGVPIFDRWVGFEYAVVPVAANPEAEAVAIAKGLEDETVFALIESTMKAINGGASIEKAVEDAVDIAIPAEPVIETPEPTITSRITQDAMAKAIAAAVAKQLNQMDIAKRVEEALCDSLARKTGMIL